MALRLPTPLVKAVYTLLRVLILNRNAPLRVRRVCGDRLPGLVPWPRGTTARRETLGGRPALRIDPHPDPDLADGALLYFHGGGYVTCSPRAYRALVTRLALGTGLPALSVDYRLAPEHPYPAAYEDALRSWDALRAGGTPAERIVIGGDSAGAGLALALAQALRDRGERPRCVVLLMPWVDYTENAGWRTQPLGRDPLLDPRDLAACADAYLGAAARDPKSSPVLGDLTGLPPLIVHTAGLDPLRVDGLELVTAARAAGTTVLHSDYPGLWHDFHLVAGLLKAADRAVAELLEQIGSTAPLSSAAPDQ